MLTNTQTALNSLLDVLVDIIFAIALHSQNGILSTNGLKVLDLISNLLIFVERVYIYLRGGQDESMTLRFEKFQVLKTQHQFFATGHTFLRQ